MKKRATKRSKKATTKDLTAKAASTIKGGTISLPFSKVEIKYTSQ